MEENKDSNDSLETLEEQATAVTAVPDAQDASGDGSKKPDLKKKKSSIVTKITNRVNVYLLGFILLIIVSLIIVFVVVQSSNKQAAEEKTISTQELTQEAIDSLSGNEATVGDPKQLLNIESNAVFAGKVLIRDGLDVAGPIKVGGDLSLPGITVSGKSAFDEVQLNSLSIAGDTSVQGTLVVQRGLTVNGQASFSGSISAPSIITDALSLTGDLQFARHIDAGGGTPSISAGAVGSGGTVTISGTDTAGTITINIGSGGGTGVLATVTFANGFGGTPHVVISPVNAAAPNAYITNRTTSGFSIFSSTQSTVSFDYIIVD